MPSTLPTNNRDRGFWGTMRHIGDPEAAWPIAMKEIGEATGCRDTAVRDFLDSRHGRHFADDVDNELVRGLNLEAAIYAAVRRWMGWTIDRHTSRETGIPRGLPYLAGFVAHFEIMADLEE